MSHLDINTMSQQILALAPDAIMFADREGIIRLWNKGAERIFGCTAEQAGPVLGWTSAIAAYGAFIIPKVFGEQIKATTPEYALYGFAVFYFVCLVINWWFYTRKNAYIQNP